MIELTIERPNGKTEKVQREGGMTDILFAKMQEATRNAGRGEIISWERIDDRTDEEKAAAREMEKEEARHRAAGYCHKCHTYCYGDCGK